MKSKVVDELSKLICDSIDAYRLTSHPDMTVVEILKALECIRYGLTENVLKLRRQKAN